MSGPKQVVLASFNEHKLEELRLLLQNLPLEVLPLSRWQIGSVEETGATFVENALIKARQACSHTGLPAIADDSGLVVPSLQGEPGIRSARYAGDLSGDEQNNRLLLQKMFGSQKASRDDTAYFCATLVFLSHRDDPIPSISTGTWHGRIVSKPRGLNGFGYDPIFQPVGMSLTAAELDPAEKNRLSHRAQAAAHFVRLLSERLGV